MSKNTYLISAEAMLMNDEYFVEFKDDNVLELSLSKEEKPFAFIVIEKDQFPGFIVCISLDFLDCYIIANLMINLMHIAPVALGEGFYRANDGILYWDEDAIGQFELEKNPELLEKLKPNTKFMQ